MATTNDRLLVATRKGLIEARRAHGRWTLQDPALAGQPIAYAVRDPRTGSLWASIDHGHWGVKLSRSRADDGTFEEVEPPKYPEDAQVSARYYWVLEPGHADAPEAFWVGTEPGGLFLTEDDGASWSLNEPLWALRNEHRWQGAGRDTAGVHSICIDPRDKDHLYVGVSIAGALETHDGGLSWAYCNKGVRIDYLPEEQQNGEYGHDPHCILLSPADPDVLWQQNHCGVYRSADGGATWDEVSAKPLVYFGFPIATHPERAETAWVVPMRSDGERMAADGCLRVMRTDDAGSTWNEHADGLPREGAYDFPYRHGLDVGNDGETLAFGTTSGNLYVSEDGGMSWQVLSNNLPLIYSVRFA